MFQSNVPLKFWTECVKTVVFFIIELLILKSKFPFEISCDKIPNYSDFRIFYSLYYVSTLLSNRHKFTLRAIVVLFLSYSKGYKSYKFLNFLPMRFLFLKSSNFLNKYFFYKNSNQTKVTKSFIFSIVTILLSLMMLWSYNIVILLRFPRWIWYMNDEDWMKAPTYMNR